VTTVGLRVLQGGRAESPPSSAGPLAELYEKHAAAVHGRCRYLLRDEAQARDALQDVFVKVLQSLHEFRAQSSPSTWILRIATHHCLNLLRSGRAQWREQLAQQGRDRKPVFEPPERRELVRMLLSAAPQEAQEVAVLYYVDELTQTEIGETLGRSLPTVRKRLREFLACAREALREAWPGIELPEGDDL
jgi:RNA polymerase sigma-70 factor (ECF subfamily)